MINGLALAIIGLFLIALIDLVFSCMFQGQYALAIVITIIFLVSAVLVIGILFHK